MMLAMSIYELASFQGRPNDRSALQRDVLSNDVNGVQQNEDMSIDDAKDIAELN